MDWYIMKSEDLQSTLIDVTLKWAADLIKQVQVPFTGRYLYVFGEGIGSN